MITRILALASAVALIGSPALAGDKKPKDPGQKIVCLELQSVGSHIPDRICKTQAAWDQEKNDAEYTIDHLGGKPNTLDPNGGAPGQFNRSAPH